MDLSSILYLRMNTAYSGHALVVLVDIICILYLFLKNKNSYSDIWHVILYMNLAISLTELPYHLLQMAITPSYLFVFLYNPVLYFIAFSIFAAWFWKIYRVVDKRKFAAAFAIMIAYYLVWYSIGFQQAITPANSLATVGKTALYYDPLTNLIDIFHWWIGVIGFTLCFTSLPLPQRRIS